MTTLQELQEKARVYAKARMPDEVDEIISRAFQAGKDTAMEYSLFTIGLIVLLAPIASRLHLGFVDGLVQGVGIVCIIVAIRLLTSE